MSDEETPSPIPPDPRQLDQQLESELNNLGKIGFRYFGFFLLFVLLLVVVGLLMTRR